MQGKTDSLWELLALFGVVVAIASAVYSLAEGVNILDAVWWSFVTAFTVGYGDISPHTVVGKLDGVFLMATVTLFILPMIIAYIVTNLIKDKNEFTEKEQQQILRELAVIKSLVRKEEDGKAKTTAHRLRTEPVYGLEGNVMSYGVHRA